MAGRAPSLWTWVATLVLAGLLLGGTALFMRVNRHVIAANELNLARISALSPGAPYVAIVGSSKVGCAIAYDDRMTALLKARGADLPAIRIAKPFGELNDFDDAFDAMAHRPPRLLLLASDFLTYEPNLYRPAGEPAGADWRIKIRQGFAAFLGVYSSPVPRAYEFNHPASARLACPPQAFDARDYVRTLSDRRAATATEQEALLRQVRRMRALGTEVALVDVPRSPAAAPFFPVRLADEAAEIRAGAAARDHLELIGEPPALPEAYYEGAAHLDGQGRAIYSEWLASRIAALLNTPHG
jgi:hypothetical protein